MQLLLLVSYFASDVRKASGGRKREICGATDIRQILFRDDTVSEETKLPCDVWSKYQAGSNTCHGCFPKAYT